MKYIFHFCRLYIRKVRSRLRLLTELCVVVSVTELVLPYIKLRFIDRLHETKNLVLIRNAFILITALVDYAFLLSDIHVQSGDEKIKHQASSLCR